VQLEKEKRRDLECVNQELSKNYLDFMVEKVELLKERARIREESASLDNKISTLETFFSGTLARLQGSEYSDESLAAELAPRLKSIRQVYYAKRMNLQEYSTMTAKLAGQSDTILRLFGEFSNNPTVTSDQRERARSQNPTETREKPGVLGNITGVTNIEGDENMSPSFRDTNNRSGNMLQARFSFSRENNSTSFAYAGSFCDPRVAPHLIYTWNLHCIEHKPSWDSNTKERILSRCTESTSYRTHGASAKWSERSSIPR
jgi:hypothetical protein